jgi:fructose-bisphosphate aldolase class II
MFRQALAGKYAIPAFNFNHTEQLQAITHACVETRSPLILQVTGDAREYITPAFLRRVVQAAVEYADALGTPIPVCLHLDHGDTFELCAECVETGFSSVMIDGSGHPYAENVALTRRVVEFAHRHDVTVEGELGVLAGVEDKVSVARGVYTSPDEVADFVAATGVDSLAIAIGTSHGANKFRPDQCTRDLHGVLQPPPLRFDILEEIERRLPGFPIVLHGASSVPADKVATINRYGGSLEGAVGIPEDQLRRAASSAVCKVNVESDARLTMTAAVRETLALLPAGFDPRLYLGAARDALVELYKHKTERVLGSAGRV